MRTRCVLLSIAVIAAGLFGLPAAPAAAIDADNFTISPSAGPAGTTIAIESSAPCPDGTVSVRAILFNPSSSFVVVGVDLILRDGGSFTGQLTVPSNGRNGLYPIVAVCDRDNGFTLSAAAFLVTSPPGELEPAVRVSGPTRIATAIAASRDAFPFANGAFGVVLSRADTFADALAGTPLANAVHGPLLLTPSDGLTDDVAAEIERVLTPGNGATVHVLGGEAALGPAIVARLTVMGYVVVRIGGVNRFDTATKVADQLGIPDRILLATGLDFRDGLIAGVAADHGVGVGVVLLTSGSTMAPETAAYLSSHPSIPRFAIGAPAVAADPDAVPLAGDNDVDTSRLVAEQFFAEPSGVGVASVVNFPDALSGGGHAAAHGIPLLLTDPATLSPEVSGYLAGRRADLVIGFAYGGPVAIGDTVLGGIRAAIT